MERERYTSVTPRVGLPRDSPSSPILAVVREVERYAIAMRSFGEIDVSILGKTLPENPKTSMLAPYSLVRSVMNLSGTFVIA